MCRRPLSPPLLHFGFELRCGGERYEPPFTAPISDRTRIRTNPVIRIIGPMA
ncbi:MAG: hypothetical protein K9J06_04475 [Flavobacteriales bacterium]|nr:hypothetical protein [Flavobacteriales bacterium]